MRAAASDVNNIYIEGGGGCTGFVLIRSRAVFKIAVVSEPSPKVCYIETRRYALTLLQRLALLRLGLESVSLGGDEALGLFLRLHIVCMCVRERGVGLYTRSIHCTHTHSRSCARTLVALTGTDRLRKVFRSRGVSFASPIYIFVCCCPLDYAHAHARFTLMQTHTHTYTPCDRSFSLSLSSNYRTAAAAAAVLIELPFLPATSCSQCHCTFTIYFLSFRSNEFQRCFE